MRYQDELRMLTHLFDYLDEPIDIGVVQRRVDLIEKAERARFGQEDREQQAYRRQRFFTAGQERDRLKFFAGRLHNDIDAGLEVVVIIGQHQLGFAAAEKAREDHLEFFVDRFEAFLETQAANPIELDDGLLQVGDRFFQVFFLTAHKAKALGELFILADRRQIDFAHSLEAAAQIVDLFHQIGL